MQSCQQQGIILRVRCARSLCLKVAVTLTLAAVEWDNSQMEHGKTRCHAHLCLELQDYAEFDKPSA